MKALVSIVVLAVALAWPSVGEAQNNKKSTARGKATTKHYVQRPAKAVAQRGAAQERCARQWWWGCVGWDPDANVRDMLARDVGDDN
jgi:hypothetical protein